MGRSDRKEELSDSSRKTLPRQVGRFVFSKEAIMDTNTLLIILVVLLVLGGGGFYGRGRWY